MLKWGVIQARHGSRLNPNGKYRVMKIPCKSGRGVQRAVALRRGSCAAGNGIPLVALVGIIVCEILIPGKSLLAGEESPDGIESQRVLIVELQKEQLDVAEKLLKRFPNDLNVILLMAVAHRSQRNSAQAKKYWQQALRRAPRDPNVHYEIADYTMRKGDFEEAVPLWRKLLQLSPKRTGVRNRLASALMELGQLHEAIVELEKEIEISPRSDSSYYLLGQAYLQLREYEKAKNNYEKAQKIEPEATNSCYGLATAYARLGEKEKSDQIMRKLKIRASERSETVLREQDWAAKNLESVRRRVASTHTGAGRIWNQHGYAWQAEKHWRRAANLAPKDTTCRLALLSLYERKGRASEALPICEQLIEIAPQDPHFYLTQGVLYGRLKRFDEASSSFQSLIERWPEQAAAYGALAEVYLHMDQKLPEAKRLATKAVQLEPTAVNYFLLGWACEKNNDRPGALEALSEAVRLDPESATYQKRLKRIQDNR